MIGKVKSGLGRTLTMHKNVFSINRVGDTTVRFKSLERFANSNDSSETPDSTEKKFNLKIKNTMKTKIYIIFILLTVASCTKSESPKPVVIEYHQAFDIVGNWRSRPYDLADYTFKKDGSYQIKYEIRYLTDTTIYGNYILSKLPKLDMWHLKFVNSQDSAEGNYIVINNNKLQDEGSVDYYFYRK